jgi:hypothetical protein
MRVEEARDGVSEATVRRAQGRLSSSPDADADDPPSSTAVNDPSQTRVIHRGGQEYQMQVERIGKAQERRPDQQTAAVADTNTRKYVESNARIDKRDVRVLYRRLSEAEQRRFLAEVIGIDDVVAWGASALDSERRRGADALFNALRSNDERLRHDDVVRAWIEEYERSERA